MYSKIQSICLVAIFDCAMCHNFELSLTIIMDNGDQYFEFFMSKNLHNATCQILINGWH
jgi:hypothetical protein